jgi:hypothetical protein
MSGTTEPGVIWVVTADCYSGYHFVTAFATQELADAYAEVMNRALWKKQSGRDYQWIYGDGVKRTYENWMANNGEEYGYRAERCQLWDRLPVAGEKVDIE